MEEIEEQDDQLKKGNEFLIKGSEWFGEWCQFSLSRLRAVCISLHMLWWYQLRTLLAFLCVCTLSFMDFRYEFGSFLIRETCLTKEGGRGLGLFWFRLVARCLPGLSYCFLCSNYSVGKENVLASRAVNLAPFIRTKFRLKTHTHTHHINHKEIWGWGWRVEEKN